MEEVVTPTESYLLDQGFYPATARHHAPLPLEGVQRYVQRRRDQGWNRNAIAQGLGREHDQIGSAAPALPPAPPPDWLNQARALCPAGSAEADVQWVATLLHEGSPPAEAQALLARRVARRASAVGGSYVAARERPVG